MFVKIVAVYLICLTSLGESRGGGGRSRVDCTDWQATRWPNSGGPGIATIDCEGGGQSPINIQRSAATADPLNIPTFFGYHAPLDGIIENTGWTVRVVPNDGRRRFFRYANNDYVLKEFHFHFGSRRGVGSEHRIEGMQYSMEMQLVHDVGGRNGIVSIMFVEVSRPDNVDLRPVVRRLPLIRFPRSSTAIRSLDLGALIPSCTSPAFYSYSGTTTKPPCTDDTEWFILPNVVEVSTRQMAQFRRLYSTSRTEGRCTLADNFRPMPLEGATGVTVHEMCYTVT